ncbi:MAG: MBOAT family O-acyltransferase [Pseudomonadota bacterium]
MLFPTAEFGIFFLLVFGIAWALVDHLTLRKVFLLGVSYVFYGWWDWRFLALLFASSAINYGVGLMLTASPEATRRRRIVIGAVAANLAILAFFKYFGFFTEQLGEMLAVVGFERDAMLLEIILPIGISFFTFQGISYVLDVSRGDIPPVRSPVDLFLYISFFPQLVAGPIVRAASFLPQLAARPRLTLETVAFGVLLIVVGLFKKVVVASYLATEIVDDVFAVPDAYSSIDLFFAAHAFIVQIYCDFSGYSDIAIGVAALLGYRFAKNFDRPLAAASLQALWQRWHISLTSWLRDYLYKPLRGSRANAAVMNRNVLIVMTVAGFWHGAAWTFIIWGLLQGLLLIGERALKSEFRQQSAAADALAIPSADRPWPLWLAEKIAAVPLLGWFVTINMFALTAVFFRAPDLETVWTYYASLLSLSGGVELFTPWVAALIAGSVAAQFLPARTLEFTAPVLSRLRPVALGGMLGGAILLVEAASPAGVAPFIYFQF